MKLLQYMGALGAMAHAPFISSVGPEFFGIDSFEELPNIKDLKSTFESPKYTKWRSLRESEDARYLGLTAPRSCCVFLTIQSKSSEVVQLCGKRQCFARALPVG